MIFEVKCDEERRTYGPDPHTYCLFYSIRLGGSKGALPPPFFENVFGKIIFFENIFGENIFFGNIVG